MEGLNLKDLLDILSKIPDKTIPVFVNGLPLISVDENEDHNFSWISVNLKNN